MTRGVELGPYMRFKPKYVGKVLAGEKRATVRYGVVRPRFNFVYIVCCDDIYGEAFITKVVYTRLGKVGEDVVAAEGFESREELVKELREIYGDLKDDDVVSIIYFTVVRAYQRPVSLRRLRGG